MLKLFANPGAFAAELLKAATEIAVGAKAGLEISAKLIQEDAQSQLGSYQGAVGGFSEWVPLAASTLADKVRKGFQVPSPLLRTGDLRDSIQYEVEPWEAVIGSTSPIAAYQEFGTSRGIPPRPFLGPAAFKNKDKITAILGATVIAGMLGGAPISFNAAYQIE